MIGNIEFSTTNVFRQCYISKSLHKFIAINSVPLQGVVQHSLLQEHGSSRKPYLTQLMVSDHKTLSCVKKYL